MGFKFTAKVLLNYYFQVINYNNSNFYENDQRFKILKGI